MPRETTAAEEVFKALGDPIRWSIVVQMAQLDELAASVLEETLPVSKPTISYHTKILAQAGLIEVHKRGRNYFHSLQRDVLREVVDELRTMLPGPRTVDAAKRRRQRGAAPATEPALKLASSEDGAPQPVLLTW